MTQHQIVDDTVARYLKLADAAAPGLVDGLYLEGSVALGDFRPHTSDIDFVAVTKTRLDPAALAVLTQVHKSLRNQGPAFEGTYLTWGDLIRDPASARPSAHAHGGRLQATTKPGHNPVTWHTLARYGVTYRGPHPSELNIEADPASLAAWTDRNLETYWTRVLDKAARTSTRWGLSALTPYGVVWTVTGVSRLHYTLSTGDITSKQGATDHALKAFPEQWHKIVREAQRIRRADNAPSGAGGALAAVLGEKLGKGGSLYSSRFDRKRDVVAFGRMVIADAHRLYTERPD